MLPPNTVSGHKVPTICLEGAGAAHYMIWLAAANSFAVDYLVRRKVGLSMSYTILDSIPIPMPSLGSASTKRCVQLAAGLTCSGSEMVQLWKQLVSDGWVSAEQRSIEDEEARLQARAEVDAIVARDILGLNEAEILFVLEDFPTAAKYEVTRWGSFRSRELILQHFQQAPTPAEVTALRIDRGRAVVYTTLLLRTWAKPVARNVLEPALILMLNDDIRSAVLGKKSPKQRVESSATARIVIGMNHFLSGLSANGVVVLQGVGEQQAVSIGPEAASIDVFPDSDKAKATETLRAMSEIDESRAMAYVKAMLDEAGQPVPTFAAD